MSACFRVTPPCLPRSRALVGRKQCVRPGFSLPCCLLPPPSGGAWVFSPTHPDPPEPSLTTCPGRILGLSGRGDGILAGGIASVVWFCISFQ